VTDFEPGFPLFAGPPDGVDPVGFIARSLKQTEVGVSWIVDSVADRDGEAGGDVAVEVAETADGVSGLVVKGIEALSDSDVVVSDCFADECFALKSPAAELQVQFRNHSPGGRDVCDGLSGEVDRVAGIQQKLRMKIVSFQSFDVIGVGRLSRKRMASSFAPLARCLALVQICVAVTSLPY